MTSSGVGLRRSSRALPKAKVAPRKGHVYCLVVCCLSGPLQLSESQGKCYIWGVCSANRWGALKTAIPTASIGQQNGPGFSDDVVQPALQRLNKLGYEVLPHVPYLPNLSPTNYHLFKHLNNFLQGKLFHKQQEAENAFQVFIRSWSTDFILQE